MANATTNSDTRGGSGLATRDFRRIANVDMGVASVAGAMGVDAGVAETVGGAATADMGVGGTVEGEIKTISDDVVAAAGVVGAIDTVSKVGDAQVNDAMEGNAGNVEPAAGDDTTAAAAISGDNDTGAAISAAWVRGGVAAVAWLTGPGLANACKAGAGRRSDTELGS